MIKMNSISGIICLVQDLDRTATFYEALGFRPGKREGDSFKVYINWFSVEFRLAKTKADNSKSGSFTCVSVDNADEYHTFAISKGLRPDSDVTDQPNGNRGFVITDPDDYKLNFFQKK